MSKSKQSKNKSKKMPLDCYVMCPPERAKEIETHLLNPLRKAFRSVRMVKAKHANRKNASSHNE
jgi:hypothetical protein